MIRDYNESFTVSGAKQYYRDLYAGKEEVQEYVDWLDKFSWDFFATFTTGHELTLPSARRAMEGFHEGMTKYFTDVKMFWVAEPFEVKEGYHTHALVKCPVYKVTELQHHQGVVNAQGTTSYSVSALEDFNQNVRYTYMVDLWQKISGGNSRVVERSNADGTTVLFDQGKRKQKWSRIDLQKYNPRRRAGGYVGKYLLKDRSDYDLLV